MASKLPPGGILDHCQWENMGLRLLNLLILFTNYHTAITFLKATLEALIYRHILHSVGVITQLLAFAFLPNRAKSFCPIVSNFFTTCLNMQAIICCFPLMFCRYCRRAKAVFKELNQTPFVVELNERGRFLSDFAFAFQRSAYDNKSYFIDLRLLVDINHWCGMWIVFCIKLFASVLISSRLFLKNFGWFDGNEKLRGFVFVRSRKNKYEQSLAPTPKTDPRELLCHVVPNRWWVENSRCTGWKYKQAYCASGFHWREAHRRLRWYMTFCSGKIWNYIHTIDLSLQNYGNDVASIVSMSDTVEAHENGELAILLGIKADDDQEDLWGPDGD